MGRRRAPAAFALAEILTVLALLAVLAPLLLEGGRRLILSARHLSGWLLARDRGQRALAFIEPRVLHCGLGFAACRDPQALHRAMDFSQALAHLEDSAGALILFDESGAAVKGRGGVFRGTSFACLYAQPSGVFLRAPAPVPLTPGGQASFDVLSGSLRNAGFILANPPDLRSWGTLPLAGAPFLIERLQSGRVFLRAWVDVTLPPVGELMLLQCDRFRTQDGVLQFQGMRTSWYPGNGYPREEGILALWCEWRPALQAFDLWVLAEGGPAAFGPASRPPEWPEEAPWNPAFAERELCVSRASWRLENL